MNVSCCFWSRLLLPACLLLAASAHATKVRFNGLSSPTGPAYEVITQGYLFEFVASPSSDQPIILPSSASPHGSDSYALCGYCYATSTFNIYRDDGSQFDLERMEIGVAGTTTDDFDFTFTGYLSGGGTVVHTANVSGTGPGVSIVTFDATWRDLASVNVSIDNSGNNPFATSTVDNIDLHQTPVISYANVPVTDGGGTNNDPKPVAMDNFILDGIEYNISINWGTSYNAVYTVPPLFEWIQYPPVTYGSSDSAEEIRYALNRASYTQLPPLTNNHGGAFVLVPGATAWTGYWGAAVELDAPGLAINPALLYLDNVYLPSTVLDYMGFVSFVPPPPPQIIISQPVSNNPGNAIHPQHDGSASSPAELNDPVAVVVFGSSIENGDTEDFYAAGIVPSSVRYGPAQATIAPDPESEFDIDVDDDGDFDARFHFLTGDTGLSCADTTATVAGATQEGDTFEGAHAIDTDCDATCHN